MRWSKHCSLQAQAEVVVEVGLWNSQSDRPKLWFAFEDVVET